MNSKTKILGLGVAGIALTVLVLGFKSSNKNPLYHQHVKICGVKGCAFKTLFGEESSSGYDKAKNPEKVNLAITSGLQYLISAQQEDGGWGAGGHQFQHIRDAHAVETDPATTAMVGMSIMRSGSTLTSGTLSAQLRRATQYLLRAVETTPNDDLKITQQENTQIQVKLGYNIDVVLTAQFFNNLLGLEDTDNETRQRVRAALEQCTARIEASQNSDGSIQGDGWAGVLQSSFANQALEGAEANGIPIDKQALEISREFQKKNYDPASGRINTDRGAGVMLYSVSGSVRAAAKEARKAEDLIEKAKQEGKIDTDAELSQESLEQIGVSRDEASRLSTSYNVYTSAKDRAQDQEVLNGFGNNGGEEFLSFLQTGESMVIEGGDDWKKWYDETAGRIVSIQNEDGSWNGHHCITSPVFCTATCLLILSIDQDIERLQKLGEWNSY